MVKKYQLKNSSKWPQLSILPPENLGVLRPPRSDVVGIGRERKREWRTVKKIVESPGSVHFEYLSATRFNQIFKMSIEIMSA